MNQNIKHFNGQIKYLRHFVTLLNKIIGSAYF